MLVSMSDARLQMAVEALQTGDRRRARRLLGQVVNDDPDNVLAWWYLTAALDDNEQRVKCLRQVLRLQPDHEEAHRMLARLERHVAQVTPPDGVPRPVMETRENTQGDLVAISEEEIAIDASASTASNRRRLSDAAVASVAVIIALLAIVGTAFLVWTGSATNLLGIHGPSLEPTLRPLTFGVEACVTVDDGTTTLVFINNTGVIIDILQGPQGEEQLLFTLGPDAQAMVEPPPDVEVRYAVSTRAEGVIGSGAVFRVGRGSTCRVPIQ